MELITIIEKERPKDLAKVTGTAQSNSTHLKKSLLKKVAYIQSIFEALGYDIVLVKKKQTP